MNMNIEELYELRNTKDKEEISRMIDKERSEMIVKAVAVQTCIKNIDMHNDWICHTTEELERLDAVKPSWITVSERGNAKDISIILGSNDVEGIIELIKEKLKKEIQEHKNSISKEYEKLNELLK